VRAALHDLAVRDDGDGVGTLDGREPVSYHKDSPSFHQGVHCILWHM